jgi:hypothetical protein
MPTTDEDEAGDEIVTVNPETASAQSAIASKIKEAETEDFIFRFVYYSGEAVRWRRFVCRKRLVGSFEIDGKPTSTVSGLRTIISYRFSYCLTST